MTVPLLEGRRVGLVEVPLVDAVGRTGTSAALPASGGGGGGGRLRTCKDAHRH